MALAQLPGRRASTAHPPTPVVPALNWPEPLDALAQADQTASGAGEGDVVLYWAVVLDPYSETTPGLVDADDDANLRTWRVPERVREALLHDPEGQVRDRLGDPVAVTLQAIGDVQPVAGRAGEQAIRQAALVKPAVLLMDVRMPELDGLAATE